MKSIVSLLILTSLVSCSMKDNMNKTLENSDNILSNSDNLLTMASNSRNSQREGSASLSREEYWDYLVREDKSKLEKMKFAGKYFKAFEFQHWTGSNGDSSEKLQVMLEEAMLDFLPNLVTLVDKYKEANVDLSSFEITDKISNFKAHGLKAKSVVYTLAAIAYKLDEVSKNNKTGKSIYSLIEEILIADSNGAAYVGEADNEVLSRKDSVLFLLKLRYQASIIKAMEAIIDTDKIKKDPKAAFIFMNSNIIPTERREFELGALNKALKVKQLFSRLDIDKQYYQGETTQKMLMAVASLTQPIEGSITAENASVSQVRLNNDVKELRDITLNLLK